MGLRLKEWGRGVSDHKKAMYEKAMRSLERAKAVRHEDWLKTLKAKADRDSLHQEYAAHREEHNALMAEQAYDLETLKKQAAFFQSKSQLASIRMLVQALRRHSKSVEVNP